MKDNRSDIYRKKILGVNVDFGLDLDEAVEKIDEMIRKGGDSKLIATTSPYFIMSAQKNSHFRKIINQAALSVPDGVGVLYANYYLNKISRLKKGFLFPIKAFIYGLISGIEGFLNKEEFGNTITGVELTQRLCQLASEKGYTIFLLGGSRRNKLGDTILDKDYDMAKHAAEILGGIYPNIRIIGASSQFSRRPNDDNKTMSYISDCMHSAKVDNIDILFVAYNPITQEQWIQRNAKYIPAKTAIGIGRTFNYITNDMIMPDKKYEKMYMMWLYTLIKQPWRLKRILMSFPAFPLKVYIESIKT